MKTQLQPWVYILYLALSFDVYGESLSSLYSATPPSLSKATDPLVMLVMSVNHELFKKAYSDYSDLDGDGVMDTTYNDSFNYLGYFDNQWCYTYIKANRKYSPINKASGVNQHFCTTKTDSWSGNFLNWATMSRIDILRQVLFGGKRFTDTVDQTILERAYLPRDIHSFVKVYKGTVNASVSSLTPFNNNTISLCNLSVSENGAPVVRVASGEWPRWASTEMRQCQWGSENSPSSSLELAENNVYIQSCVAGKNADNSKHCKSYVDGKYKPMGMLQRYGEEGSIRFGLISGGYDKNISGGLLRRNITKLTGNDDSANDEIDITTGVFNSAVNGIINHINTFRIAKYSYKYSKYLDCSTYGISTNTFSNSISRGTTSKKHCSNWGNPLAEMYLEALRYFAGEEKPSAQYNTNKDNYFIEGLSTENWVSPQGSGNACANCTIVLISTGFNSFDTDEFSAASDVPGINGVGGVSKLTDSVGLMEAAINPDVNFPGIFLADKSGGNKQCEEVEIRKLSDIRGICPESPQLEGGYHIAGLAWHGRTADLRTDLAGKQSVKTYTIQLAESIPSFSLDVAGKTVTFQPVCQAHSNRSECSLTDVVVEFLAPDKKSGRFLFTWEDSLWGNDYDYDASSSVEFCIASACSPAVGEFQVQLSVRQESKNAGSETWYSYTVTGTDKDGIVLPMAQDAGNNASQGQGATVATIFNAVGNTATQLPKPLWFAAKYGGFFDLDKDSSPGNDFNGDGSPDVGDAREWDSHNNITGATGADGLPDNYFLIRNPSLLERQLGQVFQNISARMASGTNGALASHSSKGAGTLYQAIFQPKLELNKKVVTWGGMLHALFIDNKGWVREDSNGNGMLDDYSIDRVIELIFDPDTEQTLVQRYAIVDDNKVIDGEGLPLKDLNALWDARDALASITSPVDQRTYNSVASGGRHILTWLDSNNDQVVNGDEVRPFIPATFINKEGYLGIAASKAADLVNYIRGEDIDEWRSRTIDYDLDGIDETWRLGDIINSTPVAVIEPADGYDVRYGDSSYGAFKEHYKNRRHVVYVGANDGLIHAFNGGFMSEDAYAYNVAGSSGETAHPLGYELWAYAPMNLLPHLRWLVEPDYPHVYYMDGESQAFDVNIFTADADHPGGWGTILVIGMRQGGGAIDVTAEGHKRIMRSGYVVLDVTNPEKPPILLDEITNPKLGFSTSKPVLVKYRKAGKGGDWGRPARNQWYLMFASGPAGSGEMGLRNALEHGESDQNLNVFAYDLKNKTLVSGLDPLTTSRSNSYGGDMTATDWDQDYQDDAVYFGAIDTSSTILSGELLRFKVGNSIESSSVSALLRTEQPITAAPLTLSDGNDYWIYIGTGRLLVNKDNKDKSVNSFYGVKEPTDVNGVHIFDNVSLGSLVDTTNIVVKTSGQVLLKNKEKYISVVIGGNTVNSFESLKSEMRKQSGWKIDLRGDGMVPSGKSMNKANHLFSMVLFSENQPSENSCQLDGHGFLYGLHYLTGTSSPKNILGVFDTTNSNDDLSLSSVDFGLGYLSSPSIFYEQKGESKIMIKGSGGNIYTEDIIYDFSSSGRQSWRQIFEVQ
ncbi:MAG: PilC/PilY family type IV pilus protein [Candidatus Endonucleobacter sp. (ex Gigantidas childressi)]|nr:PilC/PilY family type IV pilus protein [Candidatus Endonucleobacter sp. (ex Gigantidas childressi)]